jgi:hypothetical protein
LCASGSVSTVRPSGMWGIREQTQAGRPFLYDALRARVSSWPPPRLARMRFERESVGVVCPPGLPTPGVVVKGLEDRRYTRRVSCRALPELPSLRLEQCAAGGLAGSDVGREQRLGEPLISPELLPRPVSQRRQRPRRSRRFERGTGAPFGVLGHAGINRSYRDNDRCLQTSCKHPGRSRSQRRARIGS